MPQSIYQGRIPGVHPPAKSPSVPTGWAYIGQTVQAIQTMPTWKKASVWNWVGNNWVLLNAEADKVDYSLTDIQFDRVTLQIHDHANFDYLDYSLTVSPAPQGTSGTITIPDDSRQWKINGLTANTTYTFNLVANLTFGGTTLDSIQTIKTPANPIPPAPLNLRVTTSTNSSTNLSWTNPSPSSAVKFRIYMGIGSGPASEVKTVSSPETTASIQNLKPDTNYYYYVTGLNSTNLEGPKSNVLRWATGHEAAFDEGGFWAAPMYVHEFGSWRPDIGWYDWHYWPRKVQQDSIFQGFWTRDTRRYRGCVTYNVQEFRNRIGGNRWQNLNVLRTEIRRVYRMRQPGNATRQYMLWWLTNTNVFDSGEPPMYFGHRNNYNNEDAVAAHDSMAAGTAIDWLRLPRGYGHALVTGTGWYGPGRGVAVNGLALYRGDEENNGYGVAGYGEWCGHGQRDRAINESWRYSDWTMHISANWRFQTVAYLAPHAW